MTALDRLLSRTVAMGCDDIPLERALSDMSKEWVNYGNQSHQTLMDLRDALREAVSIIRAMQSTPAAGITGAVAEIERLREALIEIKGIGHGDGHGCGYTCANIAMRALNASGRPVAMSNGGAQ